ncbi:MAG: hypothetical protein ACFFBD_05485 [Candidatus Hodarchaeota archaeon]
MNLEQIIRDAEYVCSYKLEFDDSLGDIKPKKLEKYSMGISTPFTLNIYLIKGRKPSAFS